MLKEKVKWMKIPIVGGGNLGALLAANLSLQNGEITTSNGEALDCADNVICSKTVDTDGCVAGGLNAQ